MITSSLAAAISWLTCPSSSVNSRPDRYGEPEDAIRDEVIDVPEIGPDDALVLVMAAGVNFNNV